MSCYSPLKAFPIGRTANGKVQYKITGFDIDHLEQQKNGTWISCKDHFIAKCVDHVTQFVQIPCGKCIGCRLDYSKSWADRCLMELQYHDSAYFCTFTIDDEHLVYIDKVSETTGELLHTPTLVKKDWQDFMKALRQAYAEKHDNKLRFFMCGEYGSHTIRPHYHAIIFGLHLDDLVPYKQNDRGDWLYNSPWLESIWKKGFVVVGDVNYESCSYTARYVLKKANTDMTSVFEAAGIQPEFTLMSRRPGIGAKFLEDHKDFWISDHYYLATRDGSVSVGKPRYFMKLAQKAQDEKYYRYKLRKTSIQDSYTDESDRELKVRDTSLDYLNQLKVEEENKLSQIKVLRRQL